ncbi:Palmitoyltransferase ZDHHC17 [Larimichthys crocea]|uniref:Uncharacterized protein n=1 Tax=Larimichthys crocea TaxID=215358 RepID=A0ACD3Q6X7_LARCR|nr:Palmitoyltransferase ZDHHC17 [Larimichthys crocea]
MADAMEEYEKEAGCVPILHPEEIKPQSHYNHGYSETVSRKNHVDDYSTWDIVKATQYGIFERCRELVEAGFDVRQPDKENVTLLHWAAINNRIDLVKQGHLSMVVQLMKYGADPSLIDGEGCSCVHLAAQFGHTSIVAYLIAKGQDVDMMDQNGMTPLMWAAYRTHSVDPTRLLLTFNVSVNLGDKYHKNTALHWAVLAGNTTVISLLLDANANVDAQNIKGETPLDLAKQRKNVWMINHLQEARQAKGYDSPSYLKRLKMDKEFRQKVMLGTPFLVIWLVGFIADLDIDSWLIKGLMYAGVWVTVQFLSKAFFDHSMHSALPLGIYLATKFWILWCQGRNQFTFSDPSWPGYTNSKTDNCGARRDRQPGPEHILQHLLDTEAHQVQTLRRMQPLHRQVRPPLSLGRELCRKWESSLLHGLSVLPALHDLLDDVRLHFLLEDPLCHHVRQGWFLALPDPDRLLLSLDVLDVPQQRLPLHIAALGITTNERMNARRYKHFKVTATSIESPFNHGCFRNLIDFFEIRCCGLIRPVTVDWTTQYTIEYDQTSGSGYQLV